MDFLLECVGFPPDQDEAALIELVRAEGEPAPWRGEPADHLRLAIGEDLELRLDRDPAKGFWTLLPHYGVPHRLRVAVEELRRVPESPFDALLTGWADPPAPCDDDGRAAGPGAYLLSAWLSDARRIPRGLGPGHVLAVSIAGFAIEVRWVGPAAEAPDPSVRELPRGCRILPLGGEDSPGGCADVSGRIAEIRRLRNRITGRTVEVVVLDAPGRPLHLFVSPWQLAQDGLHPPRPSWRVEGTFLFSGRVAGGLPGPAESVRTRVFG